MSLQTSLTRILAGWRFLCCSFPCYNFNQDCFALCVPSSGKEETKCESSLVFSHLRNSCFLPLFFPKDAKWVKSKVKCLLCDWIIMIVWITNRTCCFPAILSRQSLNHSAWFQITSTKKLSNLFRDVMI